MLPFLQQFLRRFFSSPIILHDLLQELFCLGFVAGLIAIHQGEGSSY
jgi:hypothetical protein